MAQPSTQKLVSPLDRLALPDERRDALPATTQPPTAEMILKLGALETFNGVPGCSVTITLRTPRAMVDLLGSRVLEPRTGWIMLEVPSLELWEPELSKLTPEERQRIESAEFYERLRDHVTRRFLALRAASRTG